MPRSAPLLIASTAALALAADPVLGQAIVRDTASAVVETLPAPPAGSTDEVVVTGSRIARSELTSSTPISIISFDEIRNTGQGNIQDVVNELPSVGTPNISRSNSNFLTSGNGSATLNLRNLGQNRTLTLINGRRSVGVPGTSAIDVNNIPTDLIDRVEILTGGASAIYGSDAVAGVVNFILKNSFNGLRIRAQTTVSDKGDAARHTVSLTGGQSFANDHGHIIANFTFDDDQGLEAANRVFSAHDITKSSATPQGVFSLSPDFPVGTGQTFTFDKNNSLKAYQGAAVDGFDRNQLRYLAVPVRRLQGAALSNLEILDGLKLYAEGEFTHTDSASSLEPSPVASSGAGSVTNFDGSVFAGIPITNPYLPVQIRDAMQAAGVTTLQFRRRSNDIFSRSNNDRRTYWRGVGGVKGEIGDWRLDVSYEHSENRELTTTQAISAAAYGAALNAVRDASGNIVCADAAARAGGCVPINIFGLATVVPAAAAYLQKYVGPTNAASELVQGASLAFAERVHAREDDAIANINGKLFKLPGGPATVAIGAEYRREHSADVVDPYTAAGVTLGNQLGSTIGSFDVKEEYVEAVLPLLKGMRLIHDMTIEGAFRHADYSTAGGVNSWKVGGEYSPVSNLRLRGVYAQATRAPTIFELFQNQSQTFYGAIADPCDQGRGKGDQATDLRLLPAACNSIPGVAATVARTGAFKYTTAQQQVVDGLTGGNTTLRPETARTITAGMVLTPQLLPGFSLTADYYHVAITNAIGTINQNLSVQQCLATGNPVFCSAVTRDAAGFVTRVNTFNLNTGRATVAGLDIQASYSRRLTARGALTLSVYWNHLLKQQTVPYPGANVQNEVGQTDVYPTATHLGSGFRNRVYASATLQQSSLSLNYRLDYLSPATPSLTDPTAPKIPAYFYHNVQARLGFGEKQKLELYGGVNNLFDKQPPIIPDLYNFVGTNTIASTYDIYGRMIYAGVDVRF